MISREFKKNTRVGNDVRAHLPLSQNELAWIEFIRLVSNGGDPRPTLAGVQQLRLQLQGKGRRCDLPPKKLDQI